MFQIGDKVRCIDNYSTSYLTRGEIYTISGVDSIYVQLKELPQNHDYYQNRFELVKENYVLFDRGETND